MTVTEPAGPRPGTETEAIIPGYRLAQLQISRALNHLERITFAVAKERDEFRRSAEEALQEAGRLRLRVEELEEAGRTEDPVQYLLWSGRHQGWWSPNARGYTASIEHAGRYSRADALRYVVQSAQCGVREQVTSMVAAPEAWTAT